jgi:hypothetical protein
MEKNNTLKLIKEFIVELKGQIKENASEMRYHAKGLTRGSYAEAAHLDSVNECLDYVVDALQAIVAESKK